MKFLVLGASGFVGQSTYVYLKSLGLTTVGTQYSASYSGLIQFNLAKDRIENAVEPSFFQGSEPKFGIIFSYMTNMDRCAREKDLSYNINVTNIIQLIEDLMRLKTKPVFISTAAVFNGETGNYKEDDQPSPLSEYAKQKLDVEKFITKNYPEALIIRLDKVIGEDPSSRHMFTEWYHLAEKSQPIYCIEGQQFSPTYVNDVGRALFALCERNCSGIYHVTNPDSMSRVALAEAFFRKLEKKAEIVVLPQEKLNLLAKRSLRSYLNVEKIRKEIGIEFTKTESVIDSFVEKIKVQVQLNNIKATVKRSC